MFFMGYYVRSGYMGLVNDEWMLFSTEEEYRDYLKTYNMKG